MNTKTQNNISVGYGNHWPSGCVFIAPCPALFYLEGNMQEKKCSKCGEVKDVSEFHKDKTKKNGLSSYCKNCIKAHVKQWCIKNSDKHKETNKKWNKKNIIKLREYYKKSIKLLLDSIESGEKQYIEKIDKKCSKCGIVKPVNEFCKSKHRIDNLNSYCKVCSSILRKNNHNKNNENNTRWAKNNPEKRKIILERYKLNHPDRLKETIKKSNTKIRNTPKGHLNSVFSRDINAALRGTKSNRSWQDLVGYTLEQLKKHLEKQFKDGMSWDNYGKNGWHIDHKTPISVHNYNNPEDTDFKKCWALKNLQPLWAKENLIKSNKLSKPFQPSLTI